MPTKEDYIFTAIMSHISWQQIATGPLYNFDEFENKLETITSVKIPTDLVRTAIDQMVENGFIERVDTGIVGSYLKINYKPVNEYVTSNSEITGSPEYIYRISNKRLLQDLLDQREAGIKEPDNQEIQPPLTLSNAKREKLIVEIEKSLDELDNQNISNDLKAQARSYLRAAQALAEAPEPPVDLIWELIERLNSIAGIASLFVSIVALFA